MIRVIACIAPLSTPRVDCSVVWNTRSNVWSGSSCA